MRKGRPHAAMIDGFAAARSNSQTPCQAHLDLFDAAEEPLQRHANRGWRNAVPNAQAAADLLCSKCPVREPCGDGAAAEDYSGIAGGFVWYKGENVSP